MPVWESILRKGQFHFKVDIDWGSPFESQNRLEVKPIRESTLFGDPKLPLNFGVILGVILGGFSRVFFVRVALADLCQYQRLFPNHWKIKL